MTEQQNPNPSLWWRNRRWQAWASLGGIILIGALSLLGLVPEAAAPVVQSVVWALASVVIIYSGGASAVDALSKVRK